jgi:hypothetical protein
MHSRRPDRLCSARKPMRLQNRIACRSRQASGANPGTMFKFATRRVAAAVLLCVVTTATPPALSVAGLALASSAGDTCRREICDAAMQACMRADLSLIPLARTDADKKLYCARFSQGCMGRTIYPNVPWYSPETVTRFLKCPS